MKTIAWIFSLISIAASAQNLTDSKGLKQGTWSKTFPNSRIYQYKGQFKDNKPVGTFTYYYITNTVKAVIKHGANAARSEAIFYHENGKLMSYGIYRNLKKDSTWLNFTEIGKLLSTENYSNDLLNGKKTTYFTNNNPDDKRQRILSVANYTMGQFNGEYLEYYENGAISEKGTYAMGKKIGFWERNTLSGKLLIRERYKNGLRHGWSYGFDDLGKQTGKKYYFEGKLLEGKVLERKLEELKKNNIDPNN